MVRQHYGRYVWLTLSLILTATPLVGTLAKAADVTDAPLTDRPGDAQRGAVIAVDERKGNCTVCHAVPTRIFPAAGFGDLGPSLEGVGSRLSVAQLRRLIVNPRILSPNTVMPAYFLKEGLTRVRAIYVGKTILTAQDIEDLVAYLASLK